MPHHEPYVAGDNWGAILAAAAATYAVGALIYGLFFSKLWLALTGHDTEKLKPFAWRMALSPFPPILTAIGVAIVFKLARIDNIAAGVVLAFEIWLFLILPTRAYSFIYGGEKKGLLALDGVHLLVGYLVAGAIIAGWR